MIKEGAIGLAFKLIDGFSLVVWVLGVIIVCVVV